MAETQPKRPREQLLHEQQDLFSCEIEITKRHKNSYNQILSILDDNTDEEEHQETSQDLTDFFTSLQQELSSCGPLPEFTIDSDQTETEDGDGDNDKDKDKEKEKEKEKESVIRRLLEASDDELGIPNRVTDGDGGDGEAVAGKNDGFPVGLSDRLWEIEDDAANYFTLLHSELIM